MTSPDRRAPRYLTTDPLGRISEIVVGPSNCAIPARVFQRVHAFVLALYDRTRDPCSPYGSIDHWLRVDAVGNVVTWPAFRSRIRSWFAAATRTPSVVSAVIRIRIPPVAFHTVVPG